MPPLDLIQRDPGLTQRVYDALKAAIINLDLEPGTQLIESDIAARMGVSKSPVRDALQRLAGEGLVARSRAKGLAVRHLMLQEADDIYALREQLEAFAALLATPRLTLSEHEQLRAILAKCKGAIDEDDRLSLAALNRQFHGFFASHSGNQTLAEVLAGLNDKVRMISVLGWRLRPAMQTEYDQHVAIAEAAIAGDSEKAAALTRAHIHEFRVSLYEGWSQEHHSKQTHGICSEVVVE